MKKILISLLMAGMILPAAADVNRGNVRIAWDKSTYQEMSSVNVVNADYTVEPNLYYPRAKHLSDGSILLSFENDHYGWDVYTRKSLDGGKTWSDAKLVRHSYDTTCFIGPDKKLEKDKVVFVNPDFYQLKSGRILMAWQWRFKKGYNDLSLTDGKPLATNLNCGVEMVYSDDMGETWSAPVKVYQGRCWEPAFLELPSGEIQMYLTDSQEIRNAGSYACTSIIRSFDGGKTWQGKPTALWTDTEEISRTIWNERGMDGMPTAVLLDDNKGIVVPLETWSGRDVYDISPIVVRTTMQENWHTDGETIRENGGPDFPVKKQVNKDLKAFGPYSCKLSTGEVVILTNGRYKSESGVFVLVGDKMGDNFTYCTVPFLNGASGYWGSIDLLNPNELIATCTWRYPDPQNRKSQRGMLKLVKGWLNRSRKIARGDLVMQKVADFKPEGLWLLGKNFDAKSYVDFGYDAKNFYFGSYIFDKNVASFSPENSDASQILLSRGDKGTYKITVNAAGDYTIYKEEGYSWKLLAWEYGKAEVELACTINNDKDEDLGYSAKVAVPWEMLGGKPRKNEEIRIHQRHYYKSGVKVKAGLYLEDTEGENSDYPGEWLSITLK